MFFIKKNYTSHTSLKSGFSLVEVVVGVFIFSLVFITLTASFQSILTFGERNRLRSNALFLANEHIEIIRALPYDSVGTVAGLPSGSLPQNENIVFDGHEYSRRTFIQYVDDPADGLGGSDTLTADYKRAKVEISYNFRGSVQTFSLVTTMVPKSQESLIGAGVLRINVIDSDNNPVFLSNVHIVNNTVATSVDITTFTNASGTVAFPGAWAGNGYEIYISKSGYSSAQTYVSNPSNPNPSPSPYNVAENATTEVFFKIDLLSSLHIFTREWPTRSRFIDTFDDGTQVSLFTDTKIDAGVLSLAGNSGSYSASGSAVSTPFSPASLGEWLLFSFSHTTPANTSLTYHVEYDTGGGIFALIPDTDLPSNSVGFTVSPVDLGALDTTTYTTLRVVINLTTTDSNVTPEILEYKISYHEEDVPVANTPFTLKSGVTIGTDASGNLIYKYDISDQTSALGTWDSPDIDFDTYNISISGYEIAEACPSIPIVLEPDTSLNQTLTLEPTTVNNLSLQINSPLGVPVERAEVRIVGGSVDSTRSSGSCGTAYFSSLSVDTYSISIDAPGFAHFSSSVPVSGSTNTSVTLSY